jgi:hypothetical protein
MAATTHDPNRQVSNLQQSLSQDKSPLGFFLGAGCPLSIRIPAGLGADGKPKTDPLIPDIAGMTKIICQELESCDDTKSMYPKLCGHFAPHQPPNIEGFLTHLRALREVSGNMEIRQLTPSDIENAEKIICDRIVALSKVPLPSRDTPYHSLAAWIHAANREVSVELFTTNYDLLLEQSLEEIGVAYFDGFVGARRTFFDLQAIEEDALPPRWAKLWKLHGSINWRYPKEIKDGQDISVSRGEERGEGDRPMIFPSHLKYDQSRRMPYLAMMDRLRAFLRKQDALLVICGYSFGDVHINAVIEEGLKGNASAAIFALQYGTLGGYPRAIRIAESRVNLFLLGKDSAVIRRKQGKWDEKKTVDALSFLGKDWVPKTSLTDPPHDGHFELGDFALFGKFLDVLPGPPKKEPTNVG